jgi:hypothetical protein
LATCAVTSREKVQAAALNCSGLVGFAVAEVSGTELSGEAGVRDAVESSSSVPSGADVAGASSPEGSEELVLLYGLYVLGAGLVFGESVIVRGESVVWGASAGVEVAEVVGASSSGSAIA